MTYEARSYGDALTTHRVNPVVTCSAEEDMTRQADAKSCDINVIVKAHLQMYGELPPVPEQVFTDVSEGWDYADVMNRALAVQEYFGALPSEVRQRYGNDVGRFLDEIQVPGNPDRVELGFERKPEVPNEVPANSPA